MEAVEDGDASMRKPRDALILAEIKAMYEKRGYASKRRTTKGPGGPRGGGGGGGGNRGGGGNGTGGGGGGAGRGANPRCKDCGRQHRGKCIEKMSAEERATFDKSPAGRKFATGAGVG